MAGDLRVVCKGCSGYGTVPVSVRRRASALGRDESTYRERWRAVYEWMLQKCSEAEQEAGSHFARALERDAA